MFRMVGQSCKELVKAFYNTSMSSLSFPQGRASGPPEGAGRSVRALLSQVSGAEPRPAEQRGDRATNQPEGERHGAAEEGEPGETHLRSSPTSLLTSQAAGGWCREVWVMWWVMVWVMGPGMCL